MVFQNRDFKKTVPFLLALFLIFWVLSMPQALKGILFFGFVSTSILFIITHKVRPTKDPLTILCLVFLFCNILSFLIMSFDFGLSHRPKIHLLCLFFLIYILSIHVLDKKKYLDLINNLALMLTPLLAILILIHAFWFKSYFLSTEFYQSTGSILPLDTKNKLAIFLLLFFPYVYLRFVNNKNTPNIVVFTVFTLAIIYTFSKMALLAYLLVFFLFLILSQNKKRHAWHFIGLMAILGILTLVGFGPQKFIELKRLGMLQTKNPEYQEYLQDTPELWIDTKNVPGGRYKLALDSFQGFLEKPVWGHGLASFQHDHYEYTPLGELVRKPLTHNDYVQILYELGVVGMALMTLIVFFSLFALWKAKRKNDLYEILTCQIIQFLTLLFIMNFANIYDSPLFWFVLAGNQILGNNHTEKPLIH